MKYGDALLEVQNQIEAAGIPTYVDIEKAMAPCALLIPGPLRFDRLSTDSYSAEVDVYLLAPANNSLIALNELQDLLENLRSAFPTIPEAEPISFPLGTSGSIPLPGLAVTLNLNVTKD